MSTRLAVRLVLLVAMAGTIGCDRVTKHVATTTLAGQPSLSLLADTLRLEYAENPGAFLGLGADWPLPVRTALFSVANGLLLIGITLAAMRSQWPGPALLGLALFGAGGASNLIDRLAYGKVVDFINLGLGPVRTGIFNVADVAIMLGAALVVFAGYRSDKSRRLDSADDTQ
jgi:signal peptidase II